LVTKLYNRINVTLYYYFPMNRPLSNLDPVDSIPFCNLNPIKPSFIQNNVFTYDLVNLDYNCFYSNNSAVNVTLRYYNPFFFINRNSANL